MSRLPCRPRAGDRGSMALTTAVCVPALFLVLGLSIALGRITLADGAADAAARAAARTASLEREPGAAESKARRAAVATLADSGVHCAKVSVTVDASGLETPVGQTATVDATVICAAPLDDIALPGLPGTRTLESTITSVIDRYRGRGSR